MIDAIALLSGVTADVTPPIVTVTVPVGRAYGTIASTVTLTVSCCAVVTVLESGCTSTVGTGHAVIVTLLSAGGALPRSTITFAV